MGVLHLVSLANLLDVIGSPSLWSLAAIPPVGMGCLVAWLHVCLRTHSQAGWRIAVVSVSLAVAQVLGMSVAWPTTTVAGMFPTAGTLERGWWSMFGAFKMLVALEPPTGGTEGTLMAVWMLGLWGGFVSSLCAVGRTAATRMAALGLVAAQMAICALLGSSSGVMRGVAGFAVAILALVWWAWRHGSLQPHRWICLLIVAALAMAVSTAAASARMGQRLVLRDRYKPPPSFAAMTSPLSTLRRYASEYQDVQVLRVTGLPPGVPVRMAVLDDFDGMVWNVSQDSARYRRLTDHSPDARGASRIVVQMQVGQGLDGAWLPSLGEPFAVRATEGTEGGTMPLRAYVNDEAGALMISGTLREGMTYELSAHLSSAPSEERVDQARAARVDQPAARQVPEEVARLAASIAGGERPGGKTARLLARWLAEEGWFSHGLKGEHPSAPGHGAHRIAAMLADGAMVGDSEQYASLMALMARALGMASRVVVGFMPDEEQQAGDETVFTGDHAQAWVEVCLEGLGWTAFHPTPPETKTPDERRQSAPSNPRTLVRQPPPPLSDPLRERAQPPAGGTLGGDDASPPHPTDERHWRTVMIWVAAAASPLLLLALAAALLLAWQAAWLARLRRSGDANQRVCAAWRAMSTAARQCSCFTGGTRSEQARLIGGTLSPSMAQLLLDMAKQADRAAFAGQQLNDGQANACWRDALHVRRALFASLSSPMRLLARLRPARQ